jgi:hypothetical protein
MAGYSRTPLPTKLGIRPGFRFYLLHMPSEVRAELATALATCRPAGGSRDPLDFVMLFSRSARELAAHVARVVPRLTPAGTVWACWPKKSSRVASELDEHGVREVGLRAGLVDVKVCAVSSTWSGLKFVRRLADREPRKPRGR